MTNALTQAALGALANDPSFTARFGEAPADPETPESPAQADPDAEPTSGAPPAEPRKFAGKYETPEALEEGYGNALTQLSTVSAENKALRDALALLNQGKQTPAEPEPDPVTELDQYGIPADVARAAMAKVAADAIRQYMSPMLTMAQAEQEFARSNPEYQAHVDKLEAYAKENPNILAVAQALYEAGKVREAKQYVWDNYRIAKAPEFEAAAKQRDAELRAARERAKLDAGIGTTQRGTTRAPKSDDRSERMERNRALAIRGGDRHAIGRYAADLIGLPDNFGQS